MLSLFLKNQEQRVKGNDYIYFARYWNSTKGEQNYDDLLLK